MTFRAIAFACFFCSTTVAATASQSGPVALDFTPFGSSHAQSASSALAPADATFGQYPMSILGIENAIKRYDGTTSLDDGPIAHAIVAIRDWESRFPRDPWIGRELLAMQRVYTHVRTSEGFAYAQRIAAWLQTDYPGTQYAAMSGMEIGCALHGGWGC